MKKAKEFLLELWEDFGKVSKAEKFWTSLLLLTMVVIGFYAIEGLYLLWFIGGLLTIGTVADDMGDDEPVLWMLLTPLPYITISIVGIGFFIVWIYKNTIVRFNNYLNSL